jgi:hypothetical protein
MKINLQSDDRPGPLLPGAPGQLKVGLRSRFVIFIAGMLLMNGAVASFAVQPATAGGPVKVQIVQTNGGYQLYVAGSPFYIKGAGLEFGNQERLAAHGGNSFRTWRTEDGRTPQLLDRARTNHLYVTLGLSLGLERQGFDYSDDAAVARQCARIKQEVLKYKDHPALIIWAIGNELNLNAKNPKVWNAVNDISKMIHQLDPNHLTTTPLAGFNRGVIQEVKIRAPDLDLISFQMYADIINLPRYLRETAWNGPYLITEWGATGHWEVGKTGWGAPIENDSTTKANAYQKRFETVIAADHQQCIGSYVFLWGHKQERTPTWYGMFLDSGEETPAVDVMHYLWTGAWPDVRCPQLEGARLNGQTAHQNIHLQTGQSYSAKVLVADRPPTALTFIWEVMAESTDLKTGGDFETRPENLPDLIEDATGGEITLKAPPKPGAYRLFAYVFDRQDHAAHVNLPFYVDASTTSSTIQARQAAEPK